jgi:hypothetical protein
VRALTSAPGHVCFSLTEDLHGCRSAESLTYPGFFGNLCAGDVGASYFKRKLARVLTWCTATRFPESAIRRG